MTTRRLPICVALACACGALACGVGCGDGKTPALSGLTYQGASPDSSLVLLLAVDFDDPNGDLATCPAPSQQSASEKSTTCVLDTFINEHPTSSGPSQILPLFVADGIADNATQGTLHFVLELSFDGATPPSGSTFTLGARVSDAAQNTSATQEIKLRLDNE